MKIYMMIKLMVLYLDVTHIGNSFNFYPNFQISFDETEKVPFFY